ncbi:MAG: hypothetical protein WBQ19_03465 [Terriglobales bacterium]
MRRLYSTFPGGLPGVGLLLLRAAIGTRLILRTYTRVFGQQSVDAGMWSLELLALAVGIAFILGFGTPLAGFFSALAGIAVHVWHPSGDPSIVSLLSFNTIAIATAIAFLGPGTLSLDARFFGRRKIIIPRVPNS